MTTSAVYLRISKDKAFGTDTEGLAVDRQRKDIHKLLKAKGWTAGKEYLENDTSASGKVPRPEYQRMLADYAAGEFGAIAAWDLDRLWRVPSEFEHLLTLVDKEGLRLATVGGDADLATDNGILHARIKVAVAAAELSRRSARQKARFAQDREAGHNHWRGRRPFGLTLEGKLVPEEADALEEIADLIIDDNGTISAGVALLKERGIRTTFGKEWDRSPLRRTLMHPRLAGLRKHNIEIVKGKDNEPDTETYELIPGNWEAVLTVDRWETLVDKLNTPGRAKPKKTGQEYLLSGLITCSVCKGKAYGIPTNRKLKDGTYRRGYVYRCTLTHVTKTMVPTDNLVILKTLEAFLSTDYREVEADKDALKALRQARAAELKDWADWQKEAHDEGLRPGEIRPARDRHDSRLHEIEHKIAELEKVSLVRMPTLEELAESGPDDNGQIEMVFDWDRLRLEKRRRLISTVWESITILPSGKGARWDPTSVVMVPRKLS